MSSNVSSLVASIATSLSLSADVKAQAELTLTNFDILTAAEKSAQRKGIAVVLFPLLFASFAFVAGTEYYEKLRTVPWSTACYLNPAVITTPRTSGEVSAVLRLITFLGTSFSVRGGGHLQNPGFQSNNDGVVIALQEFRQLELSADEKTADVGVGLRWLEVYKRLDPFGLAVTGGRVPDVGVPGLVLGGGLSFQNGERGLACMGVTEYEVVLADGSIVSATQEVNPDLFWALKGGQSNFGIVTRIHMQTASTNIWAEARMYAPSANIDLLSALMKYHAASEADSKATLIWYSVPTGTLLVLVYNSPEKPDTFDAFDEVPHLMNIILPGANTVYGVVQALANVLSPGPLLHEMRTMSSLPDHDMYLAVEHARLEQTAALADVENITLTLVIQPISATTVTAGDSTGGTPLGLHAVPQQWLLVMADWLHPSDEPRVRAAVKTIIDVAEKETRAHGTYLSFKYANYASRDQDPLAAYGPENLAKLRAVAKKYDPKGVFQKLQFGGWKVSEAGLYL